MKSCLPLKEANKKGLNMKVNEVNKILPNILYFNIREKYGRILRSKRSNAYTPSRVRVSLLRLPC